MTAPSVIVVGAGPAGVRAAETLVRAGLRPLVLDEAPRAGGQIYRRAPATIRRPERAVYGFDAGRAKRIHAAFDAIRPDVFYRPDTIVWDASERRLHFVSEGTPGSAPWDGLILATGAIDRVIPFPGWTQPGVYTLGAAQVALKFQASVIGKRPVFFGTGPLLYLAAYQYLKAGVRPAAVLDTATAGAKFRAVPRLALHGMEVLLKGLFYLSALRLSGVSIVSGVSPIGVARGEDGTLEGFRWQDRRGRRHRTECEALAFGFHLASQTQLADLVGVDFAFDPVQRQWLPRQDGFGRALGREHVYLAGDGAQVLGAEAAELTGEQAALSLLEDFGFPIDQRQRDRLTSGIDRAIRMRHVLDGEMFPYPVDLARATNDDVMICRCEGVTAGTLRHAGRELGATDLNHAKAFTRLGMGRCQGRVCGAAAAEILASTLGRPVERTGRLRGQAPVKPISLAVLAGAQRP